MISATLDFDHGMCSEENLNRFEDSCAGFQEM
jgi:hypothetical protein